ncbi:MAG: LysE family translocator [Cytophagia bacterium]|nr:MAG: LysE family translocator [Cytophagales bacterium]TAG02817.1 MAG: LysE family translocator [Cytophagia bacterium]TAG42202.1 MAG: LysE family translocator [Cytophagia bacterium]TAH29529.1 MAG: LysE family translocator [Cytophagales bacterium]
MTIFYTGIIYGLFLAILIGPVFFALIRTSIDNGFKSGVFLAIGIAISDAFAASVVYLGIKDFTENTSFQAGMGMVGGLIMFIFGLIPFIKKRKIDYEKDGKKTNKNQFLYTLEGVILNSINPFVYIFWVGIWGKVLLQYKYVGVEVWIFMLGLITAVLMTDILKSYLANKITKYLTPQLLSLIDKGTGIALIIFGFRLLLFAYIGK